MRVLGVDACKAGWFGITLSEGAPPSAYFAPDIAGLVDAVEADGDVGVIAIDIPIGLPDATVRQADVLARAAVGPRRASVFETPVRAALTAQDHATAIAVNRSKTGKGVSAQAYALKEKIADIDAWIRTTTHQVIEIHPELSFTRLAGAPVRDHKSTWNGAETRRALLATADIVLPADLGPPGQYAKIDDVLDAAVAAWTARRHAEGASHSLPDPPEWFSDGLLCAIWA
ncbi:DUF429 domain-containing protein [Actinocorallia aurea]